MKRFHVHVAVNNLPQSTRFYSALFGTPPTVVKDDYAKWMLDDPRVNFAISERASQAGLNHLGFQADSADELEDIHARLKNADTSIAAEKGAQCCYATSDKYWVQDPSGIAWESFRSLDMIPFYGEQSDKGESGKDSSPNDGGCGATCCPTTLGAPPAANACCNA